MESECFPRKLRYDISMSKRTRKSPVNIKEEAIKSPQHPQQLINSVESREDVNVEEKGVISNEEEEEDQKKSLKQLIEGRGTSLGHHFTEEEKQLQLVVKQPEGSLMNGLKFKQMVSRYTKVLSHMIKLKRKKPASFGLKMQVHNKPTS
ncbi:uncharacterized protein LOC107780522 [Nicotiana tabacum]|uniref:Uncharacterized protein LOC107780522 n=1 Tax=Nicotiana tabacum TaxID=4097 RepID=A0A1S3YWP0_TOBAC|nr:uncharacterized protein LOC104112932 [Nicotiana tomentosiformis]XP_016456563.1 PREDICTED: uncharacterized protein LOC107780522 [Nicotiana tabacum]